MSVPTPRSQRELRLYLRLQPCPRCGTAADLNRLTRVDLERCDDGTWLQQLVGLCHGCGEQRAINIRRPSVWPELPGFSYGSVGPSTVITMEQFAEEARSHIAELAPDPAVLDRAAYFSDRRHIFEAVAATEEALLLAPDDAALLSQLEDLRTRAKHSERALGRHQQQPSSPSVAPVITRAMLDAHRSWQLGGRSGEGRLVLAGGRAPGAHLGNSMLAEARLTDCDLSKADLSFSNFALAELRGCSVRAAAMPSTIFDQALIESCDFREAALDLANFRKAVITTSDFRQCILERGELTGARVTRVDFSIASLADAVLDQAIFEDCDFRGADLSRRNLALQLGTTRATRFVRCDFRATSFEGRRLKSTTFVDCKFAGVTGAPVIDDVYLVERPDFSELGDGSDVRAADAVYAMWGK